MSLLVNGYLKAKQLENYNGPQRDVANSAIIGQNVVNPMNIFAAPAVTSIQFIQ